MSKAASSYTVSREGEFTVFSVTPGESKFAQGSPLLVIGIIATVLFFPVGLCVLGYYFYKKSKDANDPEAKGNKMILGSMQPYYRAVKVRVKSGLIQLPFELRNQYGRESITGAELHQLVARNHIMEDLGYGKVFMDNRGDVTSGVFNAARQGRLNMAKEVGWGVDAEAGGRAYTLAFGLNEITANGLMTDIHRVLNS